MAIAAKPLLTSRRSVGFRLWEGAQLVVLYGSIVAIILPIIAITWLVISKGGPSINWEFLSKAPERTYSGGEAVYGGGILPAITGTLYLMAGTILIALPVGVFGAVYITEYGQRSRFTRVLRLAIVNLAGVPSVVYGLFGFGFFVFVLGGGLDRMFFAKDLPSPTYGTGGLLWAAATLALLILPVVITASEEALLSVPASFREASLALGCTRWQTVRNVVLPSALPGIVTGLILGISRAAGETAPILLTGAAFGLGEAASVSTSPLGMMLHEMRQLPEKLHSQFMALPYHLYITATQAADIPERFPWGTALVLLMLVLGLNAVASIIRSRARAGRRW